MARLLDAALAPFTSVTARRSSPSVSPAVKVFAVKGAIFKGR